MDASKGSGCRADQNLSPNRPAAAGGGGDDVSAAAAGVGRRPFTALSQEEADLALARVLQEQERAYMMLSVHGGDGGEYADSDAGSYDYDDDGSTMRRRGRGCCTRTRTRRWTTRRGPRWTPQGTRTTRRTRGRCRTPRSARSPAGSWRSRESMTGKRWSTMLMTTRTRTSKMGIVHRSQFLPSHEFGMLIFAARIVCLCVSSGPGCSNAFSISSNTSTTFMFRICLSRSKLTSEWLIFPGSLYDCPGDWRH